MNTKELIKNIKNGNSDNIFKTIYKYDKINEERERYVRAVESFEKQYGENRENVMILSVPGRTEISGNHTDHNHGKVIASSVDCDIIAVAAASESGCNTIRVRSEGFEEDRLSLDCLDRDNYENFTSVSIIAGMCSAFIDSGYKVSGFDAYTTSDVPKGSGLSSSAAFEVMIGNILNHLFNEGKVDNARTAKFAQWSENVYFGKPCGLMDQLACAVGGIIAVDFNDPADPEIIKKDFDIKKYGYSLCIVNTGGSHSDLNADYASIPAEMKSIAGAFGQETLRGVTCDQVMDNISSLREDFGDRAVLRAVHFIRENERVDSITAAMDANDIKGFISGIKKSGDSSYKLLQNVCPSKNTKEQGIAVALMAADDFIEKHGGEGACRVHGGGFAGTMQAFVPETEVPEFCQTLDLIFGEGACRVMMIRPLGAVRII